MPTATKYPNMEGYALDFSCGEISLKGRVFTAFSNISHNQPLEEGVVVGRARQPLARTPGRLGMGEGSLEWSDLAEAMDFIDMLGDGWRDVVFPVTIVYKYVGIVRPSLKVTLSSARILDEEFDEGEGVDPLPMVNPISFMLRKINGRAPIKGIRV
jgi:hypothetical protein